MTPEPRFVTTVTWKGRTGTVRHSRADHTPPRPAHRSFGPMRRTNPNDGAGHCYSTPTAAWVVMASAAATASSGSGLAAGISLWSSTYAVSPCTARSSPVSS